MNIQSKNALITGGAIRVGKAISLELARAGADIIVNYSSSNKEALETTREIEDMGRKALAVKADISKWDEVQAMFVEIHEQMGSVDILVNNASLFKRTRVPTTSMDAWHSVTGVQIDGAFYLSNLAATDMLASKEGVIINIVDLSAWEAWPNLTAHAVGKSALLAMTRQFALELQPHVRVNAIVPGPILPPPGYTEEQIKKVADRTLLKRWGTPVDISRTVKFLIESDYINAEFITVDGGERYGRRKKQ